MWDKIKQIFQAPSGPPVIIEPVSFQDGLLCFKAEKPLKLKKSKAAAPTKMGYMEVEIDILTFDEDSEFYRGKVTDEQFVLDAMKMERRKEVRVDVKVAVTSSDFPGKKCRTEDISLNGARVVIPKKVDQGEHIGLTFHFNDPAVPKMALRCEVKWCAPTRKGVFQIGVRFFTIEKIQRKKLSRFMKNHLTLG